MHRFRLAVANRRMARGCAIAGIALFTACSFPGLKVNDGGSDVWTEGRPETYDASNNHGKGAEVVNITPDLIARLGHKRKREIQRSSTQPTAPGDAAAPLAAAEYRVGPGDVISVVVWGHPDLTNPAGDARDPASAGQVVRADGTVFYPHVGVIQVGGLTVEEIRTRLATGLARIVQEPQVDVRVLQFRSQHIHVVGDVEKPCRLPVTDQALTVLDALDGCATVRPTSTQRKVTLLRAGRSEVLDLNLIYRDAAWARSLTLRHGDQLYVEDGRWNRVFVVGEVKQQAVLGIPVSGMTLADAISDNQVGGLSLDASSGGLYVVRGIPLDKVPDAKGVLEPARPPRIYYLNAKSVDALILADQFQLQPRDVVFASSASLVSYNRAVVQLLPSLQTLIQAYLVFDDE